MPRFRGRACTHGPKSTAVYVTNFRFFFGFACIFHRASITSGVDRWDYCRSSTIRLAATPAALDSVSRATVRQRPIMESGIADLERELVVTSAQISDVDHHLAALGNERNLLKGLERGLLERLASLKKGVTLQGGVPTAGSASTSAPSAKTQHDDTESDDELAYRAEQDRPAVRHAAPVVNAEPSPSPGAMHGRLPSTVPRTPSAGRRRIDCVCSTNPCLSGSDLVIFR